MSYCRIYPCLLVRQVDQFDRLKRLPNQVNMAPCQLVWQEPKFAVLALQRHIFWVIATLLMEHDFCLADKSSEGQALFGG